ncbi:probable methyltransferase PMT27 [Coffea eugenioides]|uniref:probable methyltransferase PMT27 n=1 Tax=Coffea eugenioides TaxID=49369 RepID=UPI000F60D03B|nr:probable methyltransferase PMT27 [Coffea eugenioides]
MAIGKARSNKRSSSSSRSSTLTTTILVALCMFGLWLLAPNTLIVYPRTTTRSSATTSSQLSSMSDSHQIHPTEPIPKKSQPVFQDSQGDLPEDAIQTDHGATHNDHTDESSELPNQSSTESKAQAETDNNVSEQENNGDSDSSSDDNNEAEGDDGGGGDKDNRDVKETDPDVGENPHGAESVDEQQLQNQNSEETSITQNQEAEETREEHASASAENNQEEGTSDDKLDDHQSSDNNEHEISDEDQQKRLEQHQQQEDDQVQQGKSQEDTQGTSSHDQVEHDEAPLAQTGNHIDQSQLGGRKNPETHESQHNILHNNNSIKNISSEETGRKATNPDTSDFFPTGERSQIPKESKKNSWSTQANESENQKDRRQNGQDDQDGSIINYKWQLCNVTAGQDYIPCLDNEKAIAKLRSRTHYEHRERHCPEDAPTCLVPLPKGYKKPLQWPQSRDKIWYHNVPHTKLAEVKGHQNWVKVSGEFLTFPGGGTQFIHGALHYMDFLEEAVPDIAWGKHSRVLLDVGCGVASFGGYLFERNVLAMSFAPKDEHEAQVQFALERGIPAINAVMGTQRLPFPSGVFDVVHCARCRVPWHAGGGALLLELNRLLRPGGYFVWSATPVYQTLEEDVMIWNEMSNLTVSMCWELVTIKKDKLNSIGAAVYHKPDSNECYDKRKHNHPPMCKSDDDPNAAWYIPLQACLHKVPIEANQRGSDWPEEWPRRLQTPPYWLNRSQMGIYGKPAPEDFTADYEHWKQVVSKLYLSGLGISWSDVRNIMDMRAVYGGFAAALKDLKVWVMNVVNIDAPDTLPIIYERGLFGIYHDWCESFSAYPRTYDLLHADRLFSRLKKRCKLIPVMAEVDRIVRPGGKFIMRDDSSTIREVENVLKSLHWEVHLTFSKNQEGILSAQKTEWRPDSYAASS